MKRILTALFLILILNTPVHAVIDYRFGSAINGGTSGAMDAVDGDILEDGDFFLVQTTSGVKFYVLDADCALTESVPTVIAPDDNPGNKRWLLVKTVTGNEFYVDPSVSDIGAATTEGNRSLKDWVDTIGSSEKATIVFSHYGQSNTTTYTLSTSETVTSNITLKFENGALVQPASAKSLTAYSPDNIDASPQQQIIDTTNNSTNPLLFTVGGTVYPEWLQINTTPGTTDMYTATQAVIESISSASGQKKLIVGESGDYAVSDQLDIDFGDLILEFKNDVSLTKATQAALFAIEGSAGSELTDITILGNRNTLDGNGDGITYTYGDDDPQDYHALFVDYVNNLTIRDLRFTNGLVNSASIDHCQRVVVENSIFDNARYDNGLSIIRPPNNYSEWDASTHNNVVVRNSTFYSNYDYGLTAFHAPGVIFDGNISYDNGHDELAGGGGISIEDDNASPDLVALPAIVTNNHVMDNLNKGIFITADYVVMGNNIVRNTVKYTTDDVNELSGNGLYAPGATRIYDTGSQFIDNENNGIRTLGQDTDVYLVMHLNGTKVTGNGTKGMLLQGVDEIDFNDVHVNSNTTYGVSISNATYNTDAGEVRINNSEFSNNSGDYGIYVVSVADVKISNSEAMGNSSATAGIRIGSASIGIIQGCRSDDLIGHSLQSTVTNGYLLNNVGVPQMGTTGRHGLGAGAPSTGTFRQGEIIYSIAPTTGTAPGWMCIESGTFGAATDNTGDTDGSTAVITGITDTSDFAVGQYVDVSAGFPSTGPYRIMALTSTTMTLDTASDSSESNITVDTSDPQFEQLANLS